MLKNICAIILVALLSTSLHSCGPADGGKQQADLKGLYELVIDETAVKDIDTTKYVLTEITAADVTSRIMTDTLSKIRDWEVMCKGVRKFKVADFTRDSLHYSNFNLLFYNDKLFSLSCSVDGPMADTLKTKYPNYDAAIGKNGKSGTYLWHNGPISALFIQNGNISRYSVYNSDRDMEILAQADKAKQEAMKKSTK